MSFISCDLVFTSLNQLRVLSWPHVLSTEIVRTVRYYTEPLTKTDKFRLCVSWNHYLFCKRPCKMCKSVFQPFNGDIKISVPPDVYRLHSHAVASRSGTIRRAIEQARENADPCTDPVLIEVDLVVVPAADRKYGRLEIEAVAGVPQRPQPADLLSPKLRKIWANLVKSLDDQTPYLKPEYPASQRLAVRGDQGEEPDDILHNTKALMILAEELEATQAVFSALDEAFVGMGDGLGEAVAEDPVQWLSISVTLRDSWIFKDAGCHVVGKWHNLEHEVKMSIPEAARRVCQSHSDKLVQRCKDVEDYMMNIEFAPLKNPGPSDLLGLSPHMWVALTRFREWVYGNISRGNGFRGAEGGFLLYRYLCEEEDDDNDEYDNQWAPYLDEDDCPKEDADEVNACLLCLRELCQDKVEPLLESNVSDSSVRYLTCAEIDNEDVPWDDEDDADE